MVFRDVVWCLDNHTNGDVIRKQEKENHWFSIGSNVALVSLLAPLLLAAPYDPGLEPVLDLLPTGLRPPEGSPAAPGAPQPRYRDPVFERATPAESAAAVQARSVPAKQQALLRKDGLVPINEVPKGCPYQQSPVPGLVREIGRRPSMQYVFY